MANIGRQIALQEGFDETELVIACLLHDVSYCEDFGEDADFDGEEQDEEDEEDTLDDKKEEE